MVLTKPMKMKVTPNLQGGIAVVTDFQKDNFEKHIQDTHYPAMDCNGNEKSGRYCSERG